VKNNVLYFSSKLNLSGFDTLIVRFGAARGEESMISDRCMATIPISDWISH